MPQAMTNMIVAKLMTPLAGGVLPSTLKPSRNESRLPPPSSTVTATATSSDGGRSGDATRGFGAAGGAPRLRLRDPNGGLLGDDGGSQRPGGGRHAYRGRA